MRRILVPVDGSPSSDNAVRHLVLRVKSDGAAEVHVLHVEPAPSTRGARVLSVRSAAAARDAFEKRRSR